MNIVLVNDDGYGQEGITSLKKVLDNYGTVYTFAPNKAYSGASSSITIFLGSLKASKIDDYNYIVDGTPSDCVYFARLILKDNIDLVVSGCNKGYNLANDIICSGTIGACIIAKTYGLKSVAISSDKTTTAYNMDNYGKYVFDYLFDNNLLSNEYILSINMQHPRNSKPKGILLTKPLNVYTDYSVKSFDESTNNYTINRIHNWQDFDNSYDVCCCYNGYISMSPLSNSIFDNDIYELVKGRLKNVK